MLSLVSRSFRLRSHHRGVRVARYPRALTLRREVESALAAIALSRRQDSFVQQFSYKAQ
jgi:hypothetical protein